MIKQIAYLTPQNSHFSKEYLAARTKENRVLTDKQVEKLPDTLNNYVHFGEWELRKISTNNILKYLKEKNKHLNNELHILDIGCGNGWFSNLLSQLENANVVAIDVNNEELEQANRIFQPNNKQDNLQFVYGDILQIAENKDNNSTNNLINKNSFNIITINASIQYFENLPNFVNILKTFLTQNGEIHIIDSPFYEQKELKAAKERTLDYYSKLGFPEMSKFYFHHSFADLGAHKVLYKPSNKFFKKFVKKFIEIKESPFYWIMIEV